MSHPASLGTPADSPTGDPGRRPTLLHVDSSPRPESVTRRLTAAFADEWRAAHPQGDVRRHDLPLLDLPHLSAVELSAWFSSDAGPVTSAVLARSDRLIDDVLAADTIVIGAPMWNFSVPSVLKAWIDHLVRMGRTIGMGADGTPVGLLPGPEVVVVTGRGSDFRVGGPNEALDFQEPYLRTVLQWLGASSVVFVHADHQGPNWPDAVAVGAAAEAEVRGLAQRLPAAV